LRKARSYVAGYKGDPEMNDTVHSNESLPGQPLVDTTAYGSGRDDSVSDLTDTISISE
jgi:hypothetical protein